jgi:putative ABC transport system substrate-binding protein
MASHIVRRRFLAALSGVAAAWPIAARAQQAAMPVVGFLHLGSPEPFAPNVAGFWRGLNEIGFAENRNVAIEYRWAQGQYDGLPALAADLVRRQVAVIAACATSAPGLAAKAATSTIPIVFQTGGDPVEDGLVASMNRPGGNVTGVSRLSVTLEPKRLELLRDLLPKAAVVGFLVNPTNPRANLVIRQMEEPARALGVRLQVLNATSEAELDSVFASMVRLGIGALLVAQEPSYNRWRGHIVALASHYAMPTMYATREFVVAGGLVGYDASTIDSFRQVGMYVGRILKGEKPADLPVEQPTKFELVINLKTVKALGLEIPPTLLARADEVIE